MTDYYKPIVPRPAAEDFGVDRLKELDPMDSSKPCGSLEAISHVRPLPS